jgi:uncharacterized protein Yka (UPF0111/DUF47 family)
MERLNKSFITPLDREDIHALTSRCDDVLDYVDAVAKRWSRSRSAPDAPRRRARAASSCAARRETAIASRCCAISRNRKRSSGSATKINQLENDADQVMRDALNDLFNGERERPARGHQVEGHLRASRAGDRQVRGRRRTSSSPCS